jgi:glutaredoxin-like protein
MDHRINEATIVMYGTGWCSDCRRARKFLTQNRIHYEFVDIDQDLQARARVEALNHGMRSVPTIVFADGSVLVEPSDLELAEKFGLA